MQELIIIGAGGHAKSVIDILESMNEYKILGLVDNAFELGSEVLGYKVIGNDLDLEKLKSLSKFAFIAIGQIKNPFPRFETYQKLKKLDFDLPTVISPSSIISDKSEIGDGTIVMNGAIINAGAKVGSNCIINSGAIIEHDASIGDNTHISTNSVINGSASVGNNSFVGSGSIIRNNISIGNECIISMGSIIYKNISDGVTTL